MDSSGLLSPATPRDPYPAWRSLREADPVHFSEEWDAWLLTRHDDALAAFRDKRLSARRSGGYAEKLPAPVRDFLSPLLGNLSRWTLLLDPPDHTRLRTLISRAFTPRVVEAMRPRIEGLVRELLDAAIGRGGLDVIRDFAYPLPTVVIADMLGMRREDAPLLKAWSDAIASFMGAARMTPELAGAARNAVVEMEDFIRAVIAKQRKDPVDNLMGLLLRAEDNGQMMDEQELLATCVSLTFGGHETTTNLIGNGVIALAQNPAEYDRLRANPSLIETAVEELMRFDSPVQRMGRVAVEDLVIRGKTVQKGQRVFMVLGAANRDPLRFKNPDELDLGRAENPHLSFGYGIHYCVGAALGRLEGQCALAELSQRVARLSVDVDALEWLDNLTIRGVKRLPVSWS